MAGQHRAHEALIETPAGPVYQGLAGRTRTEQVHLREADGSSTSREIFVAVNATTDPEIAAQARAGTLHRLEDGRSLAVPFVYHDPAARMLLLVVPPVLAHLELSHWAALWTDIAADTAHPVPAYVRHARAVVGLGALNEALADGGVEPSDLELREVPAFSTESTADAEWQEVGAEEAASVPAPAVEGSALVEIDGSEVESVPPMRPRPERRRG